MNILYNIIKIFTVICLFAAMIMLMMMAFGVQFAEPQKSALGGFISGSTAGFMIVFMAEVAVKNE